MSAEDAEAPPGPEELIAAVEALVFAAAEPVQAGEIAGALGGVDEAQVEQAIDDLGRRLDGNSGGLRLERVAGGWRLATRPEVGVWVRRFFRQRNRTRLSPAALETLAIVAYKQPITAPEIQSIRGVDPAHGIKSLLEKRMIRILGRKKVVGNPLLYGTTKTFLVHFGLDRLADLPSLEDFDQFLGALSVGAGPLFPDTDAAAHASDPEAETLAEDFGEEGMMEERLQKVLSRAGIASRRAAETLIAAGRVTVNGTVVTRLGTQVDADRDAIKVDGTRVRPVSEAPVYLMLHKPRGVVTTLSDPEGRPTVRDYLRGVRGRVFPVGRLDYASEGLLLLTSDGVLARDLMHPSRGVPKTYAAKVRGTPSPEALKRLVAGILVGGRRTLPAKVRLLEAGENAWVEVTVVEGRKHQVRDMLAAVGHRVQRLRRIRYGGVELGSLRPGALRALTPREVDRLRRASSRVIP